MFTGVLPVCVGDASGTRGTLWGERSSLPTRSSQPEGFGQSGRRREDGSLQIPPPETVRATACLEVPPGTSPSSLSRKHIQTLPQSPFSPFPAGSGGSWVSNSAIKCMNSNSGKNDYLIAECNELTRSAGFPNARSTKQRRGKILLLL